MTFMSTRRRALLTRMGSWIGAIGIVAGLGCGSDDGGSGGGGTGGAAPATGTATIAISGAQTESWTFDSDNNDFTCVTGSGSLSVLIRRGPSDSEDRVLIKFSGDTYTGPDTYEWMAATGNFDQQVTVGVGSMFEYETDYLGSAIASCTLTTTEPGNRLEGELSCTSIPSSLGSADTPSDPNVPRPTVDVTMSFRCLL